MDQLEHRYAGEVGRLPAELRPGRRGVDDRTREVTEGDEIV
jgi:hypothetical protein